MSATRAPFPSAAPGWDRRLQRPVVVQKLIKDPEASVQQALARNCVDLLSSLPGESRMGLFGQMRLVVAESRCAWRIRLALADQLGTIALLFDIEVPPRSLLSPDFIGSILGHGILGQAVEAEVVPAVLDLCKDPVAVVRVAAADQMGQLLASKEEGARPRAELLAKALRVLSKDPVFQMRQVYIYMCYRLIGQCCRRCLPQWLPSASLWLRRAVCGLQGWWSPSSSSSSSLGCC